jgi:peroxiredoxin
VLADTQLAFTKALDEVLDAEGVLGSKRSKR